VDILLCEARKEAVLKVCLTHQLRIARHSIGAIDRLVNANQFLISCKN
jgi:hypothetical protein